MRHDGSLLYPYPLVLAHVGTDRFRVCHHSGSPEGQMDANLRELNGQLMEVPTSHPSAYGSGSKSYGHSWRSKRNETLNTYVIEIAI
jgi:hypothetical protein